LELASAMAVMLMSFDAQDNQLDCEVLPEVSGGARLASILTSPPEESPQVADPRPAQSRDLRVLCLVEWLDTEHQELHAPFPSAVAASAVAWRWVSRALPLA
jgi:hypothetical protein